MPRKRPKLQRAEDDDSFLVKGPLIQHGVVRLVSPCVPACVCRCLLVFSFFAPVFVVFHCEEV